MERREQQARSTDRLSFLPARQQVHLVKPQYPLLETIRALHWTYQHKVVWIVDVEFASVRQAQPVPFCIAIRDAKTNAIILRTAVDYSSTYLSDLEHLFRNHGSGGGLHAFQCVPYMAKWYHGLKTTGMSLDQIGH
jgi:hypothetical protein